MKKILFVVDKPNRAYEFMVMSWLPFLLCYILKWRENSKLNI